MGLQNRVIAQHIRPGSQPRGNRKDTHFARTPYMPLRSSRCDDSLPEDVSDLAAIYAVKHRKGKTAQAGIGR
jgi:hypothetical protein